MSIDDATPAMWDAACRAARCAPEDVEDRHAERLQRALEESAKDQQIGGDHYKSKAIQPIDYILGNELGFAEGNIVKYITRHQDKNGAEDIRKVIHYCQFILEHQYNGEE